MAVYYVSPFIASGTGTGTWANPYAMNNLGARTALVSGDEVRIVAKYISDILTATTYTATRAANGITLTAGDADWTAGDIIYFPDYGTFAKVRSKSLTSLGFGNAIPPIPLTTATFNVRRVNPTLAPALTTTNNVYFVGQPTTATISITDGWVADGTRVTDNTVISLMHSLNATTNYYINGSGGSLGEALPSGWTVDCPRTALLGGSGVSTTMTVFLPAYTFTASFFQISSNSASAGCFTGGNNTLNVLQNFTLNVTHYSCAMVLSTTLYCNTCTLNFTNFYTPTIGYWTQASTAGSTVNPFENATITFDTFIANAMIGGYSLMFNQDYMLGRLSVTLNSLLHLGFTPSSANVAFARTFGNYSLNFGSSFVIRNAAGTQVTSLAGKWALESQIVWPSGNVDQLVIPFIATPPGVTFTSTQYSFQRINTNTRLFGTAFPLNMSVGDLPIQRRISMPAGSNGFYDALTWGTRPVNLLMTFRDGTTNPIEFLGANTITRTDSTTNGTNLIAIVTMDSTTFRTAGQPSLKSYLQTFAATANGRTWFQKVIKIPVNAGQAYTVTGWTRTDQTTMTNGDIRMRVVINDTNLATQNMTTASINGWEQFTLTFTPSYTGEASLVWEHRFTAGAKSCWLTDLTIA